MDTVRPPWMKLDCICRCSESIFKVLNESKVNTIQFCISQIKNLYRSKLEIYKKSHFYNKFFSFIFQLINKHLLYVLLIILNILLI